MTFPYPDTMPALSLNVPKQTEINGIELNESLLKQWIKNLPKANLVQYSQLYLEAVKRFNTNQLEPKQRLLLTDIYRQSINQMIFQLSPTKVAQHIADFEQRNLLIQTICDISIELAISYKIIIVDGNNTQSNLKLAPLVQLAINRAGEQLSYTALQAYKFYRVPPPGILNELHQLYMLVLTSSVEDIQPIVDSQLQASESYRDLYSQFILLSICNPYGLANNQVIESYHLMGHLAPEVNIQPLPITTQPIPGHFYINCLSDRIPLPSVLPTASNQTQPPALIFNTKPTLSLVDTIFQQHELQQSLRVDLSLLKQVAPFLNTSYERKQARIPISGHKLAFIARGVDSVHASLSSTNQAAENNGSMLGAHWDILNINRSGYLLSQAYTATSSVSKASIGDFVAIFEPSLSGGKHSVRIGFIRWMRIDRHSNIKIGLSLIEGDPVPVSYKTESNTEAKHGLLIPEIQRIHQSASLITEHNALGEDSKVTIRPKKQRFEFVMQIGKTLNQGKNYQHYALEEHT